MAYQEPITKGRLLKFINAYRMVEIILVENDEPIFVLKDIPNFEDQYTFFNQRIIMHRGKFIWKNNTKVPHTPETEAWFNAAEGYYVDTYATYSDYPKQITDYAYKEFSIHRIFSDAKIRKDKKYVKPLRDLLQRYGILDKKYNTKKRYKNGKLIREKLRQDSQVLMTSGKPIERTPKQISDYKKYEYKCKDKIFIPGALPQNRSNVIMVNGSKVKIGDSLFELLLRFIVEIKKKKDGWVVFNIKAGNYQKFSNLRIALRGSLLEKDGQKFIENDGSKRYRISTHPNFITYDKKKLLQHPSSTIEDLAKQLPQR